ncbi:3205_t:CDS:2, partial [Gigaspora rosea]
EKRSREYFSNDDGIQDDQNSIPDISNDLLLQISSSVPMLALAQLFDKATVAEYSAIFSSIDNSSNESPETDVNIPTESQ